MKSLSFSSSTPTLLMPRQTNRVLFGSNNVPAYNNPPKKLQDLGFRFADGVEAIKTPYKKIPKEEGGPADVAPVHNIFHEVSGRKITIDDEVLTGILDYTYLIKASTGKYPKFTDVTNHIRHFLIPYMRDFKLEFPLNYVCKLTDQTLKEEYKRAKTLVGTLESRWGKLPINAIQLNQQPYSREWFS